MKQWKVNGETFEFKFKMNDANSMEKFMKICYELGEYGQQAPKDMDMIDEIKYVIKGYRTFFDKVFGRGTAKKIFKDSTDMDEYDEVYEDFLNFVAQCRAEANDRHSSYVGRITSGIDKERMKEVKKDLSNRYSKES